jgi:hypothetical protein
VLLKNEERDLYKEAVFEIEFMEDCTDSSDFVRKRKLGTLEGTESEDSDGKLSQELKDLNSTNEFGDRQNKELENSPSIRSLADAKSQYMKEHPVQCAICNMELQNNYPLEDHMLMKRERQCKDCKLFFAICYVLGKHQKGRCRKRTSR